MSIARSLAPIVQEKTEPAPGRLGRFGAAVIAALLALDVRSGGHTGIRSTHGRAGSTSDSRAIVLPLILRLSCSQWTIALTDTQARLRRDRSRFVLQLSKIAGPAAQDRGTRRQPSGGSG